jgi:hypothetical protein
VSASTPPPIPGNTLCPKCGKPTADLKQIRIWRSVICVLVYFRVREEVVTACPACMRPELNESLLANIVSANLAWPAMLLLYIPRYLSAGRPGPSLLLPVRNPLLHDVGAVPTPLSMFRALRAALLIVGGIMGLWLAVQHGVPIAMELSGWACFGVSVFLAVALVLAGTRKKTPD